MSRRRRGLLALLLLAVLVALPACGSAGQSPAGASAAGHRSSAQGARDAATGALPTQRQVGAETIDAFLTDQLRSIERYWASTLAAEGQPAPHVRHVWLRPGATARTACGPAPRDRAAFYCSSDDTIYVSEVFAAGLRDDRSGGPRRTGAFSVAYLLAHEYAHDVQQQLGVFAQHRAPTAEPFELQADCLAGVWAASVRDAGRLGDGDVEDATNEAQALGDFELRNPRHHGTPAQRRGAFLAGLRAGAMDGCARYLPG